MAKNKDPGLLHHRGGSYYGRFSSGGKTNFVGLQCQGLEVTRQRFAEPKSRIGSNRKAARASAGGIAHLTSGG